MLISLALVIINVRIASYFKCVAALVGVGNALDLKMTIFQKIEDYEGNVKDYVATS